MRIAIFEASRRFEEKTQSKREKGVYKTNVLTIKKTKTPPRQGLLATIPGSADSGERQQKDELLEVSLGECLIYFRQSIQSMVPNAGK